MSLSALYVWDGVLRADERLADHAAREVVADSEAPMERRRTAQTVVFRSCQENFATLLASIGGGGVLADDARIAVKKLQKDFDSLVEAAQR